MRLLGSKMDEQRPKWGIGECSVVCLTETGIQENTADLINTIDSFQTVWADINKSESRKKRGGGLAAFINNRWCQSSFLTPYNFFLHIQVLKKTQAYPGFFSLFMFWIRHCFTLVFTEEGDDNDDDDEKREEKEEEEVTVRSFFLSFSRPFMSRAAILSPHSLDRVFLSTTASASLRLSHSQKYIIYTEISHIHKYTQKYIK